MTCVQSVTCDALLAAPLTALQQLLAELTQKAERGRPSAERGKRA